MTLVEGGRHRNGRRPGSGTGTLVEETGTAGDQEAELGHWWKVEATATAGDQEAELG